MELYFFADEIVLLGASVRKMQKMIDICYKFVINPAETNWLYTNTCNSVSFDINGVAIQSISRS